MSFRDHEPVDLSRADFYRHELQGFETENVLNVFAGFVERVIGRINDGKEATVYLCEPTPQASTTDTFLAAKMYKANKFRSFENDHSYRNFSKVKDKRMAKAMRQRSKRGQKAFRNHWIESEWRYLNLLHDAGVRCPRPYATYSDGVLMGCFLDEYGPAPRLIDCKLTQQQAHDVLQAILDDVEIMLSHNVVHGDLSAYNILYNGKAHSIIDVPQAVDIRVTPDAYSLMLRDLTNLGKYFARYDLEVPVDDVLNRYF